MADIAGPGGNVSLMSGFAGHLSGWSATDNVTLVETTGFVDLGNRTYEPTAHVVTGSAVGTLSTGTANTPVGAAAFGTSPTFSTYKGAVTLTFASGATWSFNAVISNVAVNRVHDGKADVTFNFTSNGAITQAWA